MRSFVFLVFSFLIYSSCFAQYGGVRIYGGINSATNRVLAVTPSNTAHTGFHFGADARLNSGKMFFILGARYTKMDLIPTDTNDFFGFDTQHSIFSGRVGLGWHLIEFGTKSSLRGKVLGQIDSNLSYDEDAIMNRPNYNSLVDASAGVTAGLGLQLRFLTLDVEYEYGLVNLYSMEKETKADVFSVSLGFFF